MHGFGFNVNPNMDHYKMIIACGIHDKGVTSMIDQLARAVKISEVKERLIVHYEKIFNRSLEKIQQEDLPWS